MPGRYRPGSLPPLAMPQSGMGEGCDEKGAVSVITPGSQVLVGRFGAAQGVRGEIRIKSFTADPMAIARYGPLSDSTGIINYTIQRVRHVRDDMIVAKIDGINDRNTAQILTNQDLYIARNKLPPPDTDEFYIADLIGMRAISPGGDEIGIVVNAVNYGAGDLLEIAPQTGQTLLIPFTKIFAPELDFAHHRITVIVPALEDGPE